MASRIDVSDVRGLACVARLPRDDGAIFRARVERLARFYAGVLGDGMRVWSRWVAPARVGICLVDANARWRETPADGRVSFVWGLPVAADGPAGDADIDAALDDAAATARPLNGTWVLGRVHGDAVRLVTSASLVRTLRRVEGRDGVAFATRGLAAHVMTGKVARVDVDRIAELVVFDYTFGDADLLAGVDVLPDASVVELTSNGVATRSWWPLAERLAPGPATTPDSLRKTVAAAVTGLARVPGVALGLTAGRDSTLLASVLRDAGETMPTFTFGEPWFADARGARAVSRVLGWPHDTVAAARERPSWEVVTDLSRWTEGLQTASDLTRATWPWSARDVAWLGGSGGEIGRAYYWSAHATGAEWLAALRTDLRRRLAPSAADALLDHLDTAIGAAHAVGRPHTDTFDVLYALQRMGKWLGHLLPTTPIRHLLPGYLAAPVVTALLDIPRDERRTGTVFDAALDAGGTNLHRIAVRAATPPVLRRVVDGRRFRRRDAANTRDLLDLVDAVPRDTPVRVALGDEWWHRTRQQANDPKAPWARRQLWNAVAVEGLCRVVDASTV